MDKVFYVNFGAGCPFRYVALKIKARDEAEVREAMDRTTKGWFDVLSEDVGETHVAKHRLTVVVCPRSARDLDL